MHSRLLLLGLLCLSLFSSCAGRLAPGPTQPTSSAPASAQEPGPATPPAQPPREPSPALPPAAPEASPALPETHGPTVSLLAPGNEPRRPLRYAFTMRPETMVIDMKRRMNFSLMGASPDVAPPTLRMTMKIVPREISREGTLRYDGELARARVLPDGDLPPADRSKLEAELGELVGTKVHGVVTARGISEEASVEIPEVASNPARQALEQIGQSLRNVTVPLPVEPVGPGARWQVDAVLSLGVRLVERTTMTLASATRTSIHIESSTERSAPPQNLDLYRNLPPGLVMRLESMKTEGRGSIKADLRRVVPTSQGSSDTEGTNTVGIESRKVPVVTRVHIDVGIKPGP